jgi:hypothetical protein
MPRPSLAQSVLCALAFAAPALGQDAKPPEVPLEPKIGRVLEVQAEFRSLETALTVDTDEGVTFTSREITSELDRAVYLDRLDALRDKGGILRRTQFVLSASTSSRTEVKEKENGKALPPDPAQESKGKSKLTGRHIRQEWKSPLETQVNELGEPKLGASWDVDPSLFAFELESYFPKALPKDGKASGKEFLALKTTKAFPGWPRELAMTALGQVVGVTAAYGRQGLKSVTWKVTRTPAAKGKGPSITYSVQAEVEGPKTKNLSEKLEVQLSARFEVRAPSRAFPAPPK